MLPIPTQPMVTETILVPTNATSTLGGEGAFVAVFAPIRPSVQSLTAQDIPGPEADPMDEVEVLQTQTDRANLSDPEVEVLLEVEPQLGLAVNDMAPPERPERQAILPPQTTPHHPPVRSIPAFAEPTAIRRPGAESLIANALGPINITANKQPQTTPVPFQATAIQQIPNQTHPAAQPDATQPSPTDRPVSPSSTLALSVQNQQPTRALAKAASIAAPKPNSSFQTHAPLHPIPYVTLAEQVRQHDRYTRPTQIQVAVPQPIATPPSIRPIQASPAVQITENLETILPFDRGPEADVLTARLQDAAPMPATTRAVQAVHLPQMVATQLVQISQTQLRNDVLLQPEELGKVRMSFQSQDMAIHVGIVVERPETLDLMRRHIALLTSEFRSLGFEDISFEFSQGQADQSEDDGQAPSPTPQDADAIEPAVHRPPLASSSQLDLRI